MKHTGEQCVPWGMVGTKLPSFARHIQRYAWASKWAAGKRVVDLGCGCGYGSFILSMVAEHVLGMDRNIEAFLFAKGHFERTNCRFYQADLMTSHIPPADVYIAFEVLEHLRDPAALVAKLHGPLLWSLPLDRTSQWHQHDYNEESARALMAGSEFWYQSRDAIVPQERAWFGPDIAVMGVLKR